VERIETWAETETEGEKRENSPRERLRWKRACRDKTMLKRRYNRQGAYMDRDRERRD